MTQARPAAFDRVATPYRLLETLAFGPALQRSRTAFLGELSAPQRVLILGEGDGRFLLAFRQRFPDADVTVIDGSQAMLSLAGRRLADAGLAAHTTFRCADARAVELPTGPFDVIVTHYFLDCFPQPEVDALVARLAGIAAPDARWLLADFNLPARGLGRLHARLWLATMYFFFRLATGLQTRHLASPDPALTGVGFALARERLTRWSLIRSTLWHRQA